MSYILSALEKADKERRKKKGLSFETLSDSQAEFTSSRTHSRYSALVWVLGGLMVVGLVWWLLPEQVAQREPAQADPSGIEEQREPAARANVEDAVAQAEPVSVLPERLDVEGIVYIEDQPAMSRVFIQGKGYREGEYYQGDIRIFSIGETAITLSSSGISKSYPIP